MNKWIAVETTTGERNPYIVPAKSDFFKVVDRQDGQEQDTKYATLEQAQKRANALNNPDEDVDDIFFDDDTHIDYYATTTPINPDYDDPSEERAAYADN